MKVSRFYPWTGICKFQTNTGIGNAFITLYDLIRSLRAYYHTGVEYLFICVRALQSLCPDERCAPHFFCVQIEDKQLNTIMQKNETLRSIYSAPETEEIRMTMEINIMSQTEPIGEDPEIEE